MQNSRSAGTAETWPVILDSRNKKKKKLSNEDEAKR